MGQLTFPTAYSLEKGRFMPPNSQLLAENKEIIYAEPERRGHEQKAGSISSAQIGVCMHTKEHVEPFIVRVSA